LGHCIVDLFVCDGDFTAWKSRMLPTRDRRMNDAFILTVPDRMFNEHFGNSKERIGVRD
jgi:hypothetical protein